MCLCTSLHSVTNHVRQRHWQHVHLLVGAVWLPRQLPPLWSRLFPIQIRRYVECLISIYNFNSTCGSFPPPLPTLGHIWDVILLWRKRNIEKKLSLCYGIVYYYNGAQRYEQFLQVGWLYQALILFGLALSSKCLCVLDLHGATSKICLNPTLYLLVSWAWWDWLLMWLTNHCPSVLWHCWLGHVTRKIVSEMTYNVSSGTLKPTIPYHWLGQWCLLAAPDQLSISAGNACPQWADEMATMVGSLA